MVTEYQPSQRRQFMKSEEQMVETSLEDLGDMLEITFERTEDEAQEKQTSQYAENHNGSLSSHEIPKASGQTVDSSDQSNRSDIQQPSIPKEEQLLDMDFDFSEPQPKAASAFDLFDSLSFTSPVASSVVPAADSTKQPIVNSAASAQKSVPVPPSPAPPSVPSAPVPVASAPAPAPAPNKRLASNIQKFLQQSQQQKKEG